MNYYLVHYHTNVDDLSVIIILFVTLSVFYRTKYILKLLYHVNMYALYK